MTLGRLRKWVLRVVLATAATVGSVVGWISLTGNFATVIDGRVYRSAQMRPSGLTRTVRDHKVRTVLNLRGYHPESAWYRAERDATLAQGATQVDMALSSCDWMSRAQLRTLVDVLTTSDTPILVHCWHGSERSGLASAFATLLRDGSMLDEARAQFSARHLFVPWGDGVVTLRHLEQYEAWLMKVGLTHSPRAFRLWVDEGYVPGEPSREQWPFDPYPLVVTTRPSPSGPIERKVWDERGRAARREAEPVVR